MADRFGSPHGDEPQLDVGESVTLEGEVDNGFYGDSEIYVGDKSVDLDEAFKSLQGCVVAVKIERIA